MSQSSSPLTSYPLLQAWLSSPPEKPQQKTHTVTVWSRHGLRLIKNLIQVSWDAQGNQQLLSHHTKDSGSVLSQANKSAAIKWAKSTRMHRRTQMKRFPWHYQQLRSFEVSKALGNIKHDVPTVDSDPQTALRAFCWSHFETKEMLWGHMDASQNSTFWNRHLSPSYIRIV